jgi:hypothetical protein
MHWSAALSAWPRGFLGRPGQHALWLIPLKAGIVVQGGIGRGHDRGLIGHLFIVHVARDRRTERDHLPGVCVDQQQVLVGMRLLLTAVMRLLLGSVGRPLATTFGAVNRQIRPAFERQVVVCHAARVTFRLHPQSIQGIAQDREEMMNPVVGRGLTQPKVERVRRLQRIGLLIHQNAHEFIRGTLPGAFGPTPYVALACVAFQGQLLRIVLQVRGFKRHSQLAKFVKLASGHRQKVFRSFLQLIVAQHRLSITYSR